VAAVGADVKCFSSHWVIVSDRGGIEAICLLLR
jgi:hypothetical protein